MASSSAAEASRPEADMAQFMAALEERRRLVYDYLDAWAGDSAFQPRDIHDAIHSYIKRRGKALRPLVLLLSCGAAGGDEATAIPAAAAVEVFHTWTLVHDDIIDRDDTRRGSPTVHAEYRGHASSVFGIDGDAAAHYGQAVAILAGDMQQSWSFALLSALHKQGVAAELILELIERMSMWLTPTLLEGEMLDVQFSLMDYDRLSEQQVLDMLKKKTAALLEYAAWCGAMIGSGGSERGRALANDLGRFAGLCGTAFQLQDDLLGLTADEARLGKPVGSDLREGKRTLVVCRALAAADAKASRQILSTLGNRSASQADVNLTLAAIEGTGAYGYIRELANSQINQAVRILDNLPEGSYRQLLRSWAAFVLARTY